jgi:anti-sigma-K factor RskA
MNNRNSTESSTDFSNRSLVCDYVKGTLPGHLISEVEEKIASDRFFAAEVDRKY